MNGNFAPVLLQRRPKDSGLPIAGHGIPGNGMRSKVADEQVLEDSGSGFRSIQL